MTLAVFSGAIYADIMDDTEEQLRGQQNDEYKALKECFADQIVDLRKLVKVSRNPKKRKRDRLWIPLELSVRVQSHPEPIAEFDLHIKCSRKYPLVPPAIGFKNIKGIGRSLITKLHKQLKFEAANEEHRGQGCIALLIMRAQQFLEDHYRDLELNNKSFYEQMVEQKQNCDKRAEMTRRRQDEVEKIEREKEVEEIRRKILRKRELFNESKKRRDSQNSNSLDGLDTDNQSTYDYEGDLDADSTTASLTDECETQNRFEEVDEIAEDEETIVTPSRRSTFVGQVRESRPSTGDQGYSQSRVDLEYEVIEELGHGGFGTVYKVRNRVDSRFYALKKVKLNPDNETLNEKIMREVKLLSRLNHENVIRYYTAWNEIETREYRSKTVNSSTATTMDESTISSKINQESCILSQHTLSSSSDDDSDDVYHTSYLINDKNVERIDAGETTANYVVFETSGDKDENEIVESMKKALGSTLSDVDSSGDGSKEESSTIASRIKTNRWLYIQMELGQGTLREAIDQGLPKQKDRARRFFREILDGLCHIHRQGIIHRDLKPVNIFLDSMDRPKIGDFGLATTNLFIVTQSQGASGVTTATAIKPNRMSLEKLRLLASPELAGDSPGGQSNASINKSGERLKYIHNQTDNIGTPLYMSPELSKTNEGARIAKVIYSHKVDVYSLGIIYFEMLYGFKTGHERITALQDLRKKEIIMPKDVEEHLTLEDIELIRLLLTHDVAARPTSEKLSTSSLLPSIGLKEREYQNIIKQVVQNRQARTHKHMLRLLFEQNDSYVDDFVFDYEDIDHPTNGAGGAKSDSQGLLKDFNANIYALDQVKMKLELLLRSKGYVSFVAPVLMPKYSVSNYYNKQQVEDVVMLMDKNSSILTLPYDLRLPFARHISRANINYMKRFAIERIYRQRQILGYHPDQFWECCVDIVTPPPPNEVRSQTSDGEILSLIGDVVKCLPFLNNLKPILKVGHIRLVKSIMAMLNVHEEQMDPLLNCIAESISISMKRIAQVITATGSQQTNNNYHHQLVSNFHGSTSLPSHVRDDLKKDLLASKIVSNVNCMNTLINFLDIAAGTPGELYHQIEQAFNSRGLRSVKHLEEIKRILRDLDATICYGQGLGLDLPIRISAGFVLGALRSVDFYSDMIFLLECKRNNKPKSKLQSSKTVILALGGRYDRLIEKFSRSRSEVFDKLYNADSTERENRPKSAVGLSLELGRLARLVLEDHVDKIYNQDSNTLPQISQLVALNNGQLVSGSNGLLPMVRYWPHDIVLCSLSSSKSRTLTTVMASLIRQLREKGLKCYEIFPHGCGSFSLDTLTAHCLENRIPYMITVKSSSNFAADDDFLQIVSEYPPLSPGSSPSTSPRLPPGAGSPLSNNIAILYQLDKGRLKELKRCDVQGIVEYLIKK